MLSRAGVIVHVAMLLRMRSLLEKRNHCWSFRDQNFTRKKSTICQTSGCYQWCRYRRWRELEKLFKPWWHPLGKVCVNMKKNHPNPKHGGKISPQTCRENLSLHTTSLNRHPRLFRSAGGKVLGGYRHPRLFRSSAREEDILLLKFVKMIRLCFHGQELLCM